MVSAGVKSNEFPIKHLAQTFCFVFSIQFKSQIKDLADLVEILEL